MQTLGSSQVRLPMLALAGSIALGACNATDDAPNESDTDPQNSADASTIGSGPLGGNSADSGSIGQDAGSAGGAGANGGNGGRSGAAGGAGASGGNGGRSGAAGGSGTAGSGGSASCEPCLADTLNWGNSGGLVARNDRSTLSPCNAYRHTRTTFGGGGGAPALTCDRLLPCMGSGLHGIGDVIRALEHSDVQAALAKGSVLFGVDSRPVDGQVFEIMVGKGTITVGSPCPPPSSSCTPIPLGVNVLAQLLRDIDEEQLNLAPCAGMFD